MLDIKRRDFITLLGGVAACGARAAASGAGNWVSRRDIGP
jgi:hypothetical protein